MKRLFTSESVTSGHPDKVCDQISDAILDECLKQDPNSRVACETAINEGIVLVMGEITTKAVLDIPQIVRRTIREIGYYKKEDGFEWEKSEIKVSIKQQSVDIAQGVDQDGEIGAGDQGMMFGYATDETEEYMPLSIVLAHKLTKQLEILRKKQTLSYLRPDGKSQVTVEYDDNNMPKRIEAVVISTQHNETVSQEQIKRDVLNYVIKECIPEKYLDEKTRIYVNPTGRFVIGGPAGDSGLTGRKIIVDSYGGVARHGGGAFSGKDYTKVDRSAAYAARYVAKNIVAAGIAKKCEIQLAYAIGLSKPISIHVDTYGTSSIANEELAEIIGKEFDLSPAGIVETLHLKEPIYLRTATYGHFGRTDIELSWEKTDRAPKLSQYLQKKTV